MSEQGSDSQEQIQRLQFLDQNMQQVVAQKQQYQVQLLELENAIKELETSPNAYKIIGNIMVASDKETLKKDLEEKRELAELRVKTFEKQEQQLKEKSEALREEVLAGMKKE
jgi:prefoldin beta subunit